ASHELRTPLTILRTDIENAMAAQAPKKGAVDLAGSIEEVDRMADLVSNLLILSRAEEFRKPESSETKVDLQQTASLVVNRMRAYADTYHVAIRLQSGDTVWVSGNAELLFKAVRNLVKNGVDYNRTGGTVTVTVWAADAWAVVTVADTGIGMSQDELDRVFDRFYRADASRSRQTGGSGLGLSIVKSIVEQTGGSIDLESRPEHGTVATVRLPRYQH
ncbi:HAMP domain-containing histidine kinase, partial [Patescibacteria group bacterium]|nr:HAMP domain-containing histidine kinase [Patescibacteria group bacterium]